MRKILNKSLIYIFTHREIWLSMPNAMWNSELKWSFWNALKINIPLRYSFCIYVYLSLPSSYFSFYSLSFPFLHLWSHTSTHVNLCPLHWLYEQGLLPATTWQFMQNNSLPNMGAESHVSLSRGAPQGTNTCLSRVPSNTTAKGGWRTLLLNCLLLGWAKLSQGPKSKGAKDSCTLQNLSAQTATES